ncbi:MAG: riboflavin synthase [Actinomycetota bacterium]|nr:riboflavin synthase [Actinomycetota bacterium]
MFTGIVEELGSLESIEHGKDSAVLRIAGDVVLSDARHGASICVNGVCLTVVEHDAHSFTVDVMAETLRRSSLAAVAPGDPVNLERAMPVDGRFGGHIVQGHVDGTAAVLGREPGERWTVIRIELPAALARYVVEKGSITVDGVSLTVASVSSTEFTVSLIPTTLALTTLGARALGERVNLEVDVLAKYAERLLHLGPNSCDTGATEADNR